MALVTTYQAFLNRVEELGFMPLSEILPGYPSLGIETINEMWHTGLDTDPWQWKDQAAREKQLAYGCILGGNKGFVAGRMYSVFYAAYYPRESMPERWSEGMVKQITWRLWQLFEEKITLNTSQAHNLLKNLSQKSPSYIDAALQELQRYYYITISGNVQKISTDGHLYGWPSNTYSRVPDWVPADWLRTAKEWQPDEAKEQILDDLSSVSKITNRQVLRKVFRF